MNPKAMLITAVVSLASLNGSFFVWAKDQFDKLEARSVACQKNYETILQKMARLQSDLTP